jgi:methylmalonyl-CoA mutase C-terminal domain/subunit
MQRKIRVLVGKPGLDGHDRGAKVVAAALRDAGMEVIYTGLHQMPEQIVEAAIQEDVDVVALSILSGAHMTLFPEVLQQLHARGVGNKLLTGGGIIPPEDMKTLAEQGVGRLFGPGASTVDIVEYIREWFASKHGADSLTPLPASFGRAVAAEIAPLSARQHRAAHAAGPTPRPKAAAPKRAAAVPRPARAGSRAKPKAASRATASGASRRASKSTPKRRSKTLARRGATAKR